MTQQQETSWKTIVSQKRASRDAALAPYLLNDVDLASRQPFVDDVSTRSRLLDAKGQEITEINDVEALQECLRQGRFSAEEVVLAYIKRCALCFVFLE